MNKEQNHFHKDKIHLKFINLVETNYKHMLVLI